MISSGAASSSARSVALLQRPRHRRVAGLGGAQGRADAPFERFFQRRHGVPHRLGGRYVEVEQDQGLVRGGAKAAGGAAIPGRDHRRLSLVPQRRHQPRPLAFDRGRRPLQQNREGRRIAEVALRQFFALVRRGAGDAQ
jgi:hypothetical protein